jgi:deoxyribonuclease V
MPDSKKFWGILRAIAQQVITEDRLKPEGIKYIAGFDLCYFGENAVCAGVVVDAKTLKIVEQKHLVTKPEIPYVPGLLAFRAGSAILQVYYGLEHDPDVLLVNGHGIAHMLRAGLACYVGVELGKPCIGVAKSILVGEQKGTDLVVGGEVRGKMVKTREHAKPLIVSPGHLVSVETSAEIVKKCVVQPHKLPEPLHLAHRLADKLAEEQA